MEKRHEELSQLEQQRTQPQEDERHRQSRAPRRRLIVSAVTIVAVAVPSMSAIAGTLRDSGREPEGVRTFNVASRNHMKGTIKYPQTPPVGGNHNPVWQNCGFYNAPIANENAVHSLEHGAVWITYRPDLPAGQVAVLRSLAQSQHHVLVSPYENLPSPVVASAWGKQLQLGSADDPRLTEFVRAFQQGPQTPEPDAPCSGGVGQPAA